MLIHIDQGSELYVTELKVGKVEPPGENWSLAAIVEGKMIWKRSRIYKELEETSEPSAPSEKKGKKK